MGLISLIIFLVITVLHRRYRYRHDSQRCFNCGLARLCLGGQHFPPTRAQARCPRSGVSAMHGIKRFTVLT